MLLLLRLLPRLLLLLPSAAHACRRNPSPPLPPLPQLLLPLPLPLLLPLLLLLGRAPGERGLQLRYDCRCDVIVPLACVPLHSHCSSSGGGSGSSSKASSKARQHQVTRFLKLDHAGELRAWGAPSLRATAHGGSARGGAEHSCRGNAASFQPGYCTKETPRPAEERASCSCNPAYRGGQALRQHPATPHRTFTLDDVFGVLEPRRPRLLCFLGHPLHQLQQITTL